MNVPLLSAAMEPARFAPKPTPSRRLAERAAWTTPRPADAILVPRTTRGRQESRREMAYPAAATMKTTRMGRRAFGRLAGRSVLGAWAAERGTAPAQAAT